MARAGEGVPGSRWSPPYVVDGLVAQRDELRKLVRDARDMLQRGDYADNERQRARYRKWMEATREI